MQHYIPKKISEEHKNYILSVRVVPPRDGFVTGPPEFMVPLLPIDSQHANSFKGYLLSVSTAIEYELIAILALIETGGYGEAFSAAYISKAKGTFGTKEKAFLKWLNDSQFSGSVDAEQLALDLCLFRNVRNAAGHYPISVFRFGNEPDEIIFFIFRGDDHYVFDESYWVELEKAHERINKAFFNLRKVTSHPIKVVRLSEV